MNQWLNKMERRFGRYAIRDLTKYLIAIYCVGAALGLINEGIYQYYLSLNFEAVFHGQVWRLFTYLLEPSGLRTGGSFIIDIIFFAIQVNLFFLFGRTLEQAWGTFRFNMYFLSGWLLNILAALILYLLPIHFAYYAVGFQYIYMSMFFAFATLNPNMELLLWFVLPIKIKWLAILEGVLLGYDMITNLFRGIQCLIQGYTDMAGYFIGSSVAIFVALGNFLIYYLSTRDYRRISPGEIKRRRRFKKQVRSRARDASGAIHRCAVCGRTELDDPTLEFRYCSKCNGDYEYCSDHLFTHTHVK